MEDEIVLRTIAEEAGKEGAKEAIAAMLLTFGIEENDHRESKGRLRAPATLAQERRILSWSHGRLITAPAGRRQTATLSVRTNHSGGTVPMAFGASSSWSSWMLPVARRADTGVHRRDGGVGDVLEISTRRLTIPACVSKS